MIASAVFVFGTVLFLWGEVEAGRNTNSKGGPPPPQTSSKGRKPNIVLILTDDQDIELGSLKFMQKTAAALQHKGAEFRHAYVTTPMCCPSRSSLLTGMYVHNHHVYTNNDNCSSTQWQATYETRSFATYLSNAGYRTGYFGKYLNKYNGSYVPPGWREWGGLIMNSKYYNYSINMNGKKIKHGFDYHKDYYPDLIANDSVAFLRQSKKYNANKPVMLTMSFPAPHGPEDSAPQYSHLYFNITTHHTPSYDYAPNPDKQWILQVTQKMLPIHKQFTDLLMTKRLQTLQSVDAAVELVVKELERLDELNNTYIIYTSDHGYHLGQFGLIKGKSFPFEFDVRVPFLVRGPGIVPGTAIEDIVLNIDLAPTFLDMAGVEIPPQMDGRSILPLFNRKRRNSRWPDTFLIESSGRRETPYFDAKIKNRKVDFLTTKSPDLENVSMTSVKSLEISTSGPKIYESGEDFQTDFEDDDLEDEIDDFDDDDDDAEDDIDIFNDEANTNKNLTIGEVHTRELSFYNKLERLGEECVLEEMKPPCRPKQKWYCIKENNRWRKHKCKGTFKKCACFTPTGTVIYKKIQRNITRRHARIRRNIEEANNLLKALNASNSEELTNRISEGSAGCIFMPRGQVNCSTTIYQDRKSWRQSRHQINNEIHQLKQKLEKLKEIRRHLKYSKPEANELGLVDNSDVSKRLPMETTPLSNPHRHNHHTSTSEPIRKPKPNDYCHCEQEDDAEERARELKRKLKEDKLRRKLRKQRKREQLEKECASERMNCFHHDKEHWKTAPLWTEGAFCFCMNANNNTYSCVRTINSTHNFLYCEFTTGLVTFYNLRTDPYELKNQIEMLKKDEKLFLHEQLKHLVACKGRNCMVSTNMRMNQAQSFYAANAQHKKKRKLFDEQGHSVEEVPGYRPNIKDQGRNTTFPYKRSRIRRRRRKIH